MTHGPIQPFLPGEPPLSIAGVSDLEALIAADRRPDELARARSLIEAWRRGRISARNHERERPELLPERPVLVLDGGALTAALAETSGRVVVADGHAPSHPRCQRLTGHLAAALDRADVVYAVDSPLGLEALMWGRRVRCLGRPFYAGWGLTDDDLPAGRVATLEALVSAALIEHPRYVDPETGAPCSVERVIDWLALQRRMRTRFPETVYALGFWERVHDNVRVFLQGSHVRFVREPTEVPRGATVAIWGPRFDTPELARDRTVVRVEDGFVRSVGLGAHLARPLSWAMDRRGIYYDARRPSALEALLETAEIDAALVARAAALRTRLVASGLTKYNVGSGTWRRPAGDRRVVLVPGQVESDQSIRCGAGDIDTNLGLVRAARASNPDAFVVYKIHPDVLAGMRERGDREEDARAFCDEVVTRVGMAELLAHCDEVHTISSLSGFEALLRGKRVVTYGQPFYAGWGLTDDRGPPIARRTRRLGLDELVAGVLILYPTYVSRRTGRFTTPEHALEELLAWRTEEARRPAFTSQLQQQVMGAEATLKRFLRRLLGYPAP